MRRESHGIAAVESRYAGGVTGMRFGMLATFPRFSTANYERVISRPILILNSFMIMTQSFNFSVVISSSGKWG